MTYRPYPKYKDSEIAWLGEVPEHWPVDRLKYSCTINDEALPESTDSDYEISYVDIGNVDSVRGIVDKEAYLFGNAPSRARRIVSDGDTIVSTVRTYLRAIAPIKDPDDNLIVSTGFAVVRPRAVRADYASYALRSPYFIETVVSRSTGVSYPAINATEIGDILVARPSETEQRTIASFLDRETARIDALIEKKQRQIELLQEKRAALISHAVTKGLDPNVKMKESGIEWLGEVPEHWEVVSVKKVARRIQTGCTPPTAETRYYENATVPWFGPGSFQTELTLTNPAKFIHADAITEGVARLFEKHSIMIVTIGATIGKVGFIDKPASCNQQITAITPNTKKALGRFIAYQLKVFENVLRAIAPSTTLPIMDQQEVGALPSALPPLSEQRRIVRYVDTHSDDIDMLVGKIRSSIEYLHEYRTALISAAVTGKIDVREEAA